MANSNDGNDAVKVEFAALFDLIQTHRIDTIDRVRDVNLSTRALFQAEAARLAKKVGADDPRVRRFTARAAQGLDLNAALEVEAQIARVRSPVVDRVDALIQGRVVDARGAGIAGADVRVVDANGNDTGLAVAKTDASGYYAITVPAAVVEKLPAGQALRLEVAGDQGKVIPAAGGAFALAPGDRQLREVVLSTAELKRVRATIDPRLGEGVKLDGGSVVTPVQPVKPDVVKPNVVTPDVVKPNVVTPGVVRPNVVNPEVVVAPVTPAVPVAPVKPADPAIVVAPRAAKASKPKVAAASKAAAGGGTKPAKPAASPASAATPKRPAAKKKPAR